MIALFQPSPSMPHREGLGDRRDGEGGMLNTTASELCTGTIELSGKILCDSDRRQSEFHPPV
jgi:hypothetical protein